MSDLYDPYLVIRDLLEASVYIRVAAERMEGWLKENELTTGQSDNLRAQAIDLQEMARQFTSRIPVTRKGRGRKK